MNDIEEKIAYSFKDKDLLKTALTHSSYSRERSKGEVYNERLEFLGDAMLDAIIGEELFRIFPDKEEGFLSKTRASLVCETSLYNLARRINLGDCLRLGNGEEKTGGRDRNSILADAVEALIGAVFLDGGYEKTIEVVLGGFADLIEDTKKGKLVVTDYKTALQERLQAEGIKSDNIDYVDIGQEGPDHDKVFTVSLTICGKTIAQGKGKSKKQAQQNAAEAALSRR